MFSGMTCSIVNSEELYGIVLVVFINYFFINFKTPSKSASQSKKPASKSPGSSYGAPSTRPASKQHTSETTIRYSNL
jgi:hypothetical protein